MFFMLKFLAWFSLSFTLLCIPIEGTPLFGHLYQKFAPKVDQVFEASKSEVKREMYRAKKFTKKLFDSRPPLIEEDKNLNINADDVLENDLSISNHENLDYKEE